MRNRSALHFVLIIGIANFFADFTYEGARGIIGPFLGSLGASAVVVGFVAGLGELMGYGLRSVSGYFADRSHRHWAFAFFGYAINMFAVPALALSKQWPLAASLVVSERIGRGIRKPTVEAMLSYAGKSIGADKPSPAIALRFAIQPSALEFASCVKPMCQSSLPHSS